MARKTFFEKTVEFVARHSYDIVYGCGIITGGIIVGSIAYSIGYGLGSDDAYTKVCRELPDVTREIGMRGEEALELLMRDKVPGALEILNAYAKEQPAETSEIFWDYFYSNGLGELLEKMRNV